MRVLRFLVWTTTLFASIVLSRQHLCAQNNRVWTGADILKAELFAPLAGMKVGLITNHTGIDRDWDLTIDLLNRAEGVDLVALFSPEHGIRGSADANVPSGVDSITGLPIYSLYGDTRRPSEQMLKGIDALVFDMQDIGARFYTYIGTMKNCMEEAAKHRIKFIVLDRPNPINGVQVEGPVLDSSQVFDLAGTFQIPIRHGMTVGELSQMFNSVGKIGVDLKVIKMRGWRRSMWFDETGLPWVPPSPMMRNLYEAVLYPGIGLLERTNVANKKGLERPFEQFGAPWIDGVQLAEDLNNRHIPGVRFVPIRFTPTRDKYEGQRCGGVAIYLIDRDAFQSVACGIEILESLCKFYPNEFDLERIWHLTRSRELIQKVKQQIPIRVITEGWQAQLEQFKLAREQYLLY